MTTFMTITVILFWSALALIIYTYGLFPVVLFFRSLVFRRAYKSDRITPHVSMIIAAHNEADVIGTKIENILALDYPKNRLEVLIASDGSDDKTADIVSGYNNKIVKLLALPRQGKAPALNAAVAEAKGEILIFSDANSIYATDAIRALVRPFADTTVGGVAGNQVYLSKKDKSHASVGEKSYWNFDRRLKLLQSKAGSTTSATGAIYAIRRKLFQAVPSGVTDDFVTSTRVIAQGYRLVFAPDAIAYEPAAETNGNEFKRKVRVITRGLRAVLVMRELLNPIHFGFYSLQLFSHKVLRRLVVFPLLIVLTMSPFLWSLGPFYKCFVSVQLLFYSFAIWGVFGNVFKKNKLMSIPFYFCLVNIAAFLATLNLIRGHQIDRWDPQH